MSQERPHPTNPGEPDDEFRQQQLPFERFSANPYTEAESEEWLANHPELEGVFADLRSLREQFQSASPPEPSAAVWSATQERIQASLNNLPAEGRRVRHSYWVVLGSTAAAVFLGFLMARALWWGGGPSQVVAEEPLPVVDPADITIVSMDARDITNLVVGEPPISGELVFARPDDIKVIHCTCCPISGQTARLEEKGEVPMLVAVGGNGGGTR